MKDTEVLALFYQAASVTPGEPAEHAADMWCEILRDLDYNEARQAMIKLLRTKTFISPADVHNAVKPEREWHQL